MADAAKNDVEFEEFRRKILDEALEVQSLKRIVSAYLNYPKAAEEDVRRNERSFGRLPPAHKELLTHLPSKFLKLRWCIAKNSHFISEMLKAFDPPLDMSQDIDVADGGGSRSSTDQTNLEIGTCRSPKEIREEQLNVSNAGSTNKVMSSTPSWLDLSSQLHVPLVDVDKVRCIIRNIVRDWASEGQKERDQCYKPILEALHNLFPNRREESPPSCLVPGAGLGRLALEISCLGFICQGNEFSYYMMMCSNFILNYSLIAGEWTIYPWIHSNCNSLSDSDQLRPVSVPDIHPASAGTTEGFTMCGGEFVEVYSDPSQVGAWDAVVTCFFLDTAHNIVKYIETISRILKEGGVWINLGPLLYHFAEMYGRDDEMSIELSLEDVKKVALHYGFKFEQCSTLETTYTTNPRSMMQNRYSAAFWIMRKSSPGKEGEGLI